MTAEVAAACIDLFAVNHGSSFRIGYRMAYRRTENVIRRLHARQNAIVEAAREAAITGGMAAVQILPVAERAGVAAGTVYRYFPSKNELVGALVESVAER